MRCSGIFIEYDIKANRYYHTSKCSKYGEWGFLKVIQFPYHHLTLYLQAYQEEKDRVVLKLKPELAPYKAAVFPLLANKPELIKKAREVFGLLKNEFPVAWDERGNIGKRYYSQDEIGTPYCLTIDFDSLKNNDLTLRDRNTTKQERVKISELETILKNKLK